MKIFYIYFLFFSIAVSCIRIAEDSIFLIPKEYEGTIIVLFDQKDGQPVEYSKSGERIYRIPANGILKSKFSSNTGNSKWKIYYIDNKGSKTPIPIIYSHERIDSNSKEIVCYNPRIGANVKKYEQRKVVKESSPYLDLLICSMDRIKDLSNVRNDFSLKATQN